MIEYILDDLEGLADFVAKTSSSLVVLTAFTETTANELAKWTTWMPEISKMGKPIIGFGGYIFSKMPSWRTSVTGVFFG